MDEKERIEKKVEKLFLDYMEALKTKAGIASDIASIRSTKFNNAVRGKVTGIPLNQKGQDAFGLALKIQAIILKGGVGGFTEVEIPRAVEDICQLRRDMQKLMGE